jgi:hypothetical protein
VIRSRFVLAAAKRSAAAILLGIAAVAGQACASAAPARLLALNEYGLPLKKAPDTTAAEITLADLMTRLYIFADDSMMGRMAGREGNMKGTDYIARELTRLGVQPGGENGTYFQSLPFVARTYAATSTLAADGQPLRWDVDFIAMPPGLASARPISGAQAIYGGVAGDTTRQITRAQGAGKIVVLSLAVGAQPGTGGAARFLPEAAAVALVDLHLLTPASRAFALNPPGILKFPGSGPVPATGAATLRITPSAAGTLLGAPIDGMQPGRTGASVSGNLVLSETPVPQFARNVIGIVKGGDSTLAGQYVAIGAHNDHVGFNVAPVDHDSARAAASAALAMQMASGELRPLTPAQRESIRVSMDSLRLHRPARPDSIFNGADDDGSGSMALLEIAEAMMNAPRKPRRSILFVWHTSEERFSLAGSNWFTQNPTVPRDSIIAQINVDMIGRGRSQDVPGGGNDYLAVIGSRRLSSEMGQAVIAANLQQVKPLRLDYRLDDSTSWPGYNNLYGRSDHMNYARYNIPIAFFFTGLHQDYHRVTDEPQYIDYPHYESITRYLHDLTAFIANRPKRLAVDKPGGLD